MFASPAAPATAKMTKKTLALGLVAVVLTALTILDNLGHLGGESRQTGAEKRRQRPAVPGQAATTAPVAAAPAPAATPVPAPAATPAARPAGGIQPPAVAAPATAAAPAAPLAQAAEPRPDLATLRQLREHSGLVTKRYQSVAASYAEHVAGMATLYPPGARPHAEAEKAIRALVPAGVAISDLLVSGPAGPGIVRVAANIVMSSGDSQAMTAALLALGDPGSGMTWKELNVGVDATARIINARGQLTLLMLPQAE